MKQVFQDARSAEISVAEVPAPKLLPGSVLVRTAASLVSAGTERASSQFASSNLLRKAFMRPDLVRDVLGKISRDGLLAAAASVRSRLDQPSAPGYSSAGTVIAVGQGVTDVHPGDRVACAGAGHALHAEFACIPRLLLARIPSPSVSFEAAAFTTLGAVALHGIRNADAKLGDVVAVIGLGLLGQIAVQILKAAGCRALGMDISPDRANLALRLGADAVATSSPAFQELCLQHSAGHGVDSVVIAAQSSSNDPVTLAGSVARHRAIVVAVGTVGMEIPRRTFYDKELDFRLSRSYGPGRYDPAYELKGIDYPIGYVRWTETRNMEAFLRLLTDGKLNLDPLITHRFPIAAAHSAYELINGKSSETFLGVLIAYPQNLQDDAHAARQVEIAIPLRQLRPEKSVNLGLIGAGSFAMATLLPVLKEMRCVELSAVASATGSHARHAAHKFGFPSCTTDENSIFASPQINTVVIATRHHLHARQVISALNAGKHVFCEKPLCLNPSELGEILLARQSASIHPPLLMVGFNRRFAPMAAHMKTFFAAAGEPLALHYRVNAGPLPSDHWLHDPAQGGGRIIAEVCHFVDFLRFLAGSSVTEVETRSLPNSRRYSGDNVICSLRFADGSQATITYVANGDKSFSKERIEIFGGGRVAALEDFRRLQLVCGGKKKIFRSLLRQDKGHRAEWEAFAAAITTGGQPPIPLTEIVNCMMATFALEESRSCGKPVLVKVPPSPLAPDLAEVGQAS
jgi:predicted dehydrogenase/threonine dehydrogenase-like Zn-dependent dehydrogenase